MTRYVVVSFLPETVSYTLKRAREHFEPGVNGKIPPHISLTYPFWWKRERNELVKKIEKEIKNFSPFLATISGTGVFNHSSSVIARPPQAAVAISSTKVLYLKVLPEEPFKKIHDSLHKTLTGHAKFDTSQFPQKTLPSFIPHITLAMNPPAGGEKDVETAKKMISSVIGYSFMVETILLLKKEEENEKWEKIKSVCLKSKKE